MALIIKRNAYETIHTYVVLAEREAKDPFTVEIKLIKSKDMAKLDDGLTQINNDQSVTLCSGSYNFNLLKKGLVNWKNLVDENNNEVPIIKNTDGTVKDESLSNIPIFIINEIADLIATASRNPEAIDALIPKTDAKPKGK